MKTAFEAYAKAFPTAVGMNNQPSISLKIVHQKECSVSQVKNRTERLVVLNRVAQSVIESVRGNLSDYVFVFTGQPQERMNNSAWRKARERVGLAQVRIHDHKHTFGRRLRAAGVSFEDRQDLLGHKSGRITTHYSDAELSKLIEAANNVCGTETRKSPALVLLRGSINGLSN